MKRFVSLSGWNPVVLNDGDIVLIDVKGTLKVGRVVNGYNNGKDPSKPYYVESLDGKHKYYPYTQETCLLSDETIIKDLEACLKERE